MFDARHFDSHRLFRALAVRATLEIDDDVLAAVKRLAAHRRQPMGAVMSALAREALQRKSGAAAMRNGVPLLQVRAGATPATLAVVNQLRDELR